MQNIELVYDVDCPNVEGARAVLREALQEAGLDPEWIEWDREDPISPPHARMYGSPRAAGAPIRLRVDSREPMTRTMTVNAYGIIWRKNPQNGL